MNRYLALDIAALVLAVLAGYWWVFGRAPEGREDEHGFHRVRKGE